MRNLFKKLGIYLSLILIPILLIICLFYLYHNFDLKTVIIISTAKNVRGLNIFNSTNLLSLDTVQINKILEKQNPIFYSIKISKKFPQTIQMETINRNPVAFLKRARTRLYIDKEAVLFTSDEGYTSLPSIDVDQFQIFNGQKVDWKLQKAVFFIQESEGKSINVDQIIMNDQSDSFIIKIAGGTEILLPFSSDAYIEVSSLQVILQRFKILGKNIKQVDFRFDKPVVTLSSGEKISSSL